MVTSMMSSAAIVPEVAALLVGLRMKGETAGETGAGTETTEDVAAEAEAPEAGASDEGVVEGEAVPQEAPADEQMDPELNIGDEDPAAETEDAEGVLIPLGTE